jgi:hypothetical protein
MRFIVFFYSNHILSLCIEAFGIVLFKNDFDRILKIVGCYRRSNFDVEIQSRDAIRDVMDLGYVYWKSLLGVGIGMYILNINDFNTNDEE